MPNRVNFDISRLPDRILNLFVRGASEGNRLVSPVVRAVHDALIAEIARRQIGGADDPGSGNRDQIEIELPLLNEAEAVEAKLTLEREITWLNDVAFLTLLKGETKEAEDLSEAGEFLFQVWEACVPPGGNAKLIPVQ